MSAGRTIEGIGDARHASALAILCVHAVIAFVDSLCVRFAGKKSTSMDYLASIKLLRSALGSTLPNEVERLVERIVSEKDRFEYQGYVATQKEARALMKRAEQFAAWTERRLAEGG
jgi:hypothetical protein